VVGDAVNDVREDGPRALFERLFGDDYLAYKKTTRRWI
jgi:hypothetical protein